MSASVKSQPVESATGIPIPNLGSTKVKDSLVRSTNFQISCFLREFAFIPRNEEVRNRVLFVLFGTFFPPPSYFTSPTKSHLPKRSQVHRKFLLSNSTSHVWPFGAIAELLGAPSNTKHDFYSKYQPILAFEISRI
jgi:hypothetical protein